MWIARDKNGSLWLYDTKPVKDSREWVIPNTCGGYCKILESNLDVFEEIMWEDDEPRELILK